MGEIKEHPPVLLLVAAFTQHDDGFEWARRTIEASWGSISLESEIFAFDQTEYYSATMGPDLRKKFFAMDSPCNPSQLVEIKHQTNAWETRYQEQAGHVESRPLNLDPGYLTEAKLVLATTKDRDHRIYLDRGIYAETTLYYFQGGWQPRPWTYPDYAGSTYHAFFNECRQLLRDKYRTRKKSIADD